MSGLPERYVALRNILNTNKVASENSNLLNNILRDANLITDNQLFVGVLSGGRIHLQ